VVAHAVHGRGEAKRYRADPAAGVGQREVLAAAAHRVRTVVRRRVVLGHGSLGDARCQPGGEQERSVAALERVEHLLDGGVLVVAGAGVVGEVVFEGEMDDAVGGCRTGGEAVEVFEAAAVGGGALGLEGGGRLLGLTSTVTLMSATVITYTLGHGSLGAGRAGADDRRGDGALR
jgi:hypothetical protein